MDLTLDQLLVLDAVDRTGSFAGAAAALHRVPSAISYTVKGLEETLGLELFDRSGRSAVLTATGRRILAKARSVLVQARSLEKLALELRGGWEPELHVVVDGALPMSPITRCLAAFNDPAIPTRVRLDVEYQEGVVDRFEADQAHLMGIIGFQGDGDDAGYDAVALPELPLVLVAAPDHPLCAIEAPDAASAGRHAELVVRDSSPRYASKPKRSFMNSQHVVYLSDFHSKRVALVEGVGFGWIPRHFVDADLTEGRLRLIPIDGRANWSYSPQIVTRTGESLGRAGALFLETLQANLQKN